MEVALYCTSLLHVMVKHWLVVVGSRFSVCHKLVVLCQHELMQCRQVVECIHHTEVPHSEVVVSHQSVVEATHVVKVSREATHQVVVHHLSQVRTFL